MKATKPAERQVNRGLHFVGVSYTCLYKFIADLSKPFGLTQVSYEYIKTSVTNPDEIQAAVDLAFSRFGSLRGVINCAGIGNVVKTVSKKKFGALEAARQIIEVNLMGTYNVISIASTPMANGVRPSSVCSVSASWADSS